MIRQANMKDVKAIHSLLQIYGDRGELLPRPLSKIYDHVRDFAVYEDQESGKILGCCSLQFCWEDLGEVRSLAVHPDFQKRKIGTKLVEWALSEAVKYDVGKVFTLTYRPSFFQMFDFVRVDRSELPLKIWSDCILCVKFPDCDEIAMMKEI